MVFSSQNLDINDKINDGVNYLHFIFKGKFTEDTSTKSCAVWLNELEKNNSKQVLVWDCLNMDGFENAAKNEWLKTLKLANDKISEVIVVSDNMVIRGASRLMFKFMSFESNVVKSLEALPWH